MMVMPESSQQLVLELLPVPRWGGRRNGAGRKPGPSPRDLHRPRPLLASRFPCHVTLKAQPGLPSLRTVRFVQEFERSLRAACERGRFRVAHYAIQPDHVHLIVEATSREDLSAGMKSIGSRLARAVNRVFCRRGPVLADRYHLHILRTPREVRRAIAYVLMNARRHAAKRRAPRSASPRVDPASSGRWFDGWRKLLGRAQDPPAVAPPRTWLLRIGWRRHGLVDPGEVPGERSCGGSARQPSPSRVPRSPLRGDQVKPKDRWRGWVTYRSRIPGAG